MIDRLLERKIGPVIALALMLTGIVLVTASSGSFMENFQGSAGNDSWVGTQYADHAEGHAGADHLDGWYGADLIWGGRGNDVVIGGPGNDRLYGGCEGGGCPAGRNTLQGFGGNDFIAAENGLADYVRGGAGTDTCRVDAIDDAVCETEL